MMRRGFLYVTIVMLFLTGVGAQSGGVKSSPVVVGVGDSLTMGTQSGTNLGAGWFSPRSPLPQHLVPPTQENGWFALFYARVHGIALDPARYNLDTPLGNPALSPLPLIRAPGLGPQLFYSGGGLIRTHLGCDGFDRDAFAVSNLAKIRENPAATTYDISVPGITLHEALTMTAPAVGPPQAPVNGNCNGYYSRPSQLLVAAESQLFYPVLGRYRGSVRPLTEVNVALSLKPNLVIIWLGANDVLKYVASAGHTQIVDTPAQFQRDFQAIVERFKARGARVIVATLPTFLHQPQFFRGGTPAAPSQSVYAYLQILSKGQISAQRARSIVAALAQPEPRGCGVARNGYLTLSGILTVESIVSHGKSSFAACPLDATGPGSGLGSMYLTDAFAISASELNARYNRIIALVARREHVALADVNAAWEQVYEASAHPPYAYRLPGTNDTVDMRFGGHFFSFDGLHPSNTGYAYTANVFIETARAAFGLHLQPLPLDEFYRADPYAIR